MYQQTYFFPAASDCNKLNHPDKERNAVSVMSEDLYTEDIGYGFITEQNMKEQPLLLLPELNGGFMPVPWYHMLTPAQTDNRRQLPLRFKCKVPSEGSYRVTVTIHAKEPMSDIRIFTGRRCLAAYLEKLSSGETFVQEMYTEVCGIIPRGQEQVYNDFCIEVSVTADHPQLSTITIEKIQCPVLYIAGDSTVTDQSAEYPYAPQTSYAGWGQMLPYFIKGALPVSNHSHSGLTTESFRCEKHADIPMNRVKPGDYMLFQFGHNDQKLLHLKAYEGYSANLKDYITECRDKGVYPIIVTPVARNSWRGSDGTYNDLLAEYADACLELGCRMNVPVLDLHRFSMEFIIKLQKEKAKKYFYPSDYTHYNDFGAQRMAAVICQEMKSVCHDREDAYQWLAAQMKEEPNLWSEPEDIEVLQKPEGFVLKDVPEEFEEPDRPEDTLLRAEALDMVIRRAGFFMTNVYNDLFTDIVGHEWYAGVVECGLQNGIVTEDMCKDKKFKPSEPITLLDFICFLTLAYKSRRTLPKTQPCPYDGAVPKPLTSLVSAACQLGLLSADGTDLLNESITRHQGAALCRKLKIM